MTRFGVILCLFLFAFLVFDAGDPWHVIVAFVIGLMLGSVR